MSDTHVEHQDCIENDDVKIEDVPTEEKSENEDVDDQGTADSGDKVDDVSNGKATEGLSKRQQKRIKKHERWLELKAERRKEEKLKKKRKFAAARERGDLGPSRKALKKNSMENSRCKVKVVIDCSFDDYMSEKDVRHLVQQIQHSYSSNRRADNPLQYYVCGLSGKAQERLEEIGDYKGWDVYMKTETYLEIFPKESVVYLSSDSPTVLQELEEDKVYVIGGLVDHNHHKGLCHRLAEEKGVCHAQLPISEYIDMKTRKVLTVNHVFEILLRYTESRDWKKAFFQVLPQRKGVKDKEEEKESPSESCSGRETQPLCTEVNDEKATTKSEQCNMDITKIESEISSKAAEAKMDSEPVQGESKTKDSIGREITPSNPSNETIITS